MYSTNSKMIESSIILVRVINKEINPPIMVAFISLPF